MGGSASKGASGKKDGNGTAAGTAGGTATATPTGTAAVTQGDSGTTAVEAVSPSDAPSSKALQTPPAKSAPAGASDPQPQPLAQAQSPEDLDGRFGKNGGKRTDKDEPGSPKANEITAASKPTGPQKPTTNPDIPVQSAWSMDNQSKDKSAADQRLQKIPDPPPHEPDEPDSPPPKGRSNGVSPTTQPTKEKQQPARHYDDDDDDEDDDKEAPVQIVRNPSPPIYIPNPVIFPTQKDDPDDDFDFDFGKKKGVSDGANKEEPTNEWEDAEEILKDSMSIKSRQHPNSTDQIKDVAFTDNNSPQASGRGTQNIPTSDKRTSDKRVTDKMSDGKENSDGNKSARKGRSSSTGKKSGADERSNSKERDSNPNDHLIMGKDVFDPNKFRQANQKHNNAAEDIFRYPTYGSYILKSKEADSSPSIHTPVRDPAIPPAFSAAPSATSIPAFPNLPGEDQKNGGFTHEEEHLLDDILSSNRS